MSEIVIWRLDCGLRVVERERQNASPAQGMAQEWTEYQVKRGRRVLSRHSNRREAKYAADALIKSENAAIKALS